MTSERPGRYDGQFRPAFSKLHEDRDLLWVTRLPVRYLVAVVGYRCAGKSTVVSHLSERGFEVYTLSTLVRQIAEARGLMTSRRDVLERVGNETRMQARRPGPDGGYGDGGYLARRVLRQIHSRHHRHSVHRPVAPRIAVTGFKHPDELRVFEHLRGFHLFVVRAVDPDGNQSEETELETRAMRAFHTGVLAGALKALGHETLSRQCEPGATGKTAAEIRDVFKHYLDDPDLYGREVSEGRPELAQSAKKVVELAHEYSTPPARATTLLNGDNTKLEELYDRIDDEVRQLDLRYRERAA